MKFELKVVAMPSRERVRCLALVAVLAAAAYPALTTAEHDDSYENEAVSSKLACCGNSVDFSCRDHFVGMQAGGSQEGASY